MPDRRTQGEAPGDFAGLLFRQDHVVSRRQALRHLSPASIQHRLESGRWRAAHRGVYLTNGGDVPTEQQRRWIASLTAGAGRPAVLGGVSALAVLGLRGFSDSDVHVLLPAGRADHDPPIFVVVHRTRLLSPGDVHRFGSPPCTFAARSIIDAAQWANRDERARAIIAAAFQQRLVANDDINRVLDRLQRVRRRALIIEAAQDAAGGAHSVPEAEELRLCRRASLPHPTCQVRRLDTTGRRRYLDACFEEWGVHVEVDGGQHIDVRHWWADMKRQNELWIPGGRVLRFPAWVVRHRADEVAAQVRAALTAAGWRPG